MLELAEICLRKLEAKDIKDDKLDKRSIRGVWVGRSDDNNEHMLIAPKGEETARTVTSF